MNKPYYLRLVQHWMFLTWSGKQKRRESSQASEYDKVVTKRQTIDDQVSNSGEQVIASPETKTCCTV